MNQNSSETKVLVTGASGYIALHCVLQLLQQGYAVRGTVRSLERESHLRAILADHIRAEDQLEFVEADLTQDSGWAQAVNGCQTILHVASPFPSGIPKHEDDLIVPAREGTLRVLRAAWAAGIQRVVLTSSMAAIAGGHDRAGKTFDESDWTDTQGNMTAYAKSKTIAERAAWDFVAQLPEKERFELVVINPGFVLGPILDGEHLGTSAFTIQRMMKGEYPGMPQTRMSIVDVRDVAKAHIAAMTTPEAVGKRYICVADVKWMQEIAQILNGRFAEQGYKASTRVLPNFLVRLVALVDSSAKTILPELGQDLRVSNDRIKQDLQWQPLPVEQTLFDMGQSLIDKGVV